MTQENAIQHKNGSEQAKSYEAYEVATPFVDIYENDEEYFLQADLPGVAEEDVDIQFNPSKSAWGELRLRAPRPLELDGDRLGQEFGSARFERAFQIPQKIDVEGISAVLEDGVLELRLPKAAEVRPRKIKVKAAS